MTLEDLDVLTAEFEVGQDDDSDCDPILRPYADVVDHGGDEPECDHVSREVPPPAEGAGEAETRRAEYAADADDAERDPDPMDDLRGTRIAEDQAWTSRLSR